MLIIAHRGASSIAPDNTLKSFQKAIELGADYIEFDVRKTKDGKLVIIHDDNTFLRYKKYLWVRKSTLSQLRELDMGEGEKILTLEELIEHTKGKIGLQCEIKVRGIVEQVLEIMNQYDVLDSTLFSSFKHSEMVRAKKLEPTIKIGMLSANPAGLFSHFKTRIIEQAKKRGFDAVHPYHPIVTQEFVDVSHENNLGVYPWTVNSRDDIQKLIEFGVDGIITNDVTRVKDIMNQTGGNGT
jgi:glycerophosphoryl diester phosphodiesterase